jgi:hypothetical protein
MIPQVQILAVPNDVFRKWYDELLLLWVISRVFLQNIYRLPVWERIQLTSHLEVIRSTWEISGNKCTM